MCLLKELCVNPMLRQLIFSMHSCLNSLSHYSPHFVPLGSKTITRHTSKHPYQTRSKSRALDEVEEVQEQIKADMSALKDQMASMMEAMLSMRRLIESNATMVVAASTAAEADPALPSATNLAHQLTLDKVGRGEDILGNTNSLCRRYNKHAYPYDLPSNFTPPTMNENANLVVPFTFIGQPPQLVGGAREEPRKCAQGDIDSYPFSPLRDDTQCLASA